MECMMLHRPIAAVCAALLACACSAQAPAKKGQPHVKKQSYGKMPDGTPVDLYLLTNSNGMEAVLTAYGGTLVSLPAPDLHGALPALMLALDPLAACRPQPAWFGALTGRYGNRLAGGQ